MLHCLNLQSIMELFSSATPAWILHLKTLSLEAQSGGLDDHYPSIPKRNGTPCPQRPRAKQRGRAKCQGQDVMFVEQC